MLHLPENLKKYRILKGLTQEDIAEYLHVTPQSVSKWERGESYPDITLLPALANIFETSIDLLVGMDAIRAKETRYNIHKKAVAYQRCGDYDSAEKTYRDALLIYPNKPGMILGLASTLALKGNTDEAIELMEKLDIYKPYIKDFQQNNLVCYFEHYGGFWAFQEPKLQEKLKDFEDEYEATVYAITHEFAQFGEYYSFLIVTNYKHEWKTLLRSNKNKHTAFAYVWNKSDDLCSEFGSVAVKSGLGGITRIG